MRPTRDVRILHPYSWRILGIFAGFLAMNFIVAPPVNAEEPPAQRARVDIGVGTVFPTIVAGVHSVAEFPFRLQLRADIGWLGSPYVEAIDSTLNAVGAYGSGERADATSELVRAAVRNSLAGRFSVGVVPLKRAGLELFAGYSFSALGGGLSPTEAVETITQQTLPGGADAITVNLRSSLHSFHLGVGWRWFVGDRLVVRTSLEYLQTVESRTKISFQGRENRSLPAVSNELNAYLNELFTTWVKVPVIGISIAYRF